MTSDLPHTRLSRLIDPFLQRIGDAASWLWIVLMVTILGNVVLRYAFGEGRIELEEIQWHLYAVGFLLGLGYALQADTHIRVDVLHERFSPRLRAWIELYGIVLLLLPFIAVVLVFSVPFVVTSISMTIFEKGCSTSSSSVTPRRSKSAVSAISIRLISIPIFAAILFEMTLVQPMSEDIMVSVGVRPSFVP